VWLLKKQFFTALGRAVISSDEGGGVRSFTPERPSRLWGKEGRTLDFLGKRDRREKRKKSWAAGGTLIGKVEKKEREFWDSKTVTTLMPAVENPRGEGKETVVSRHKGYRSLFALRRRKRGKIQEN